MSSEFKDILKVITVVFVIAVFIDIIFSNGSIITSFTKNSDNIISNDLTILDSEKRKDENKNNWKYSFGKEPMGEYHIEIASVSSGGIDFQLQNKAGVRTFHFTNNSGKIVCGERCFIRVKFDNSDVFTLEAKSSKNNVISGLINSDFIERIKKYKIMMVNIEVSDYGILNSDGSQYFNFDVTNTPFTGIVRLPLNKLQININNKTPPEYIFDSVMAEDKISFNDCISSFNDTAKKIHGQAIPYVEHNEGGFFVGFLYHEDAAIKVSCNAKSNKRSLYKILYI